MPKVMQLMVKWKFESGLCSLLMHHSIRIDLIKGQELLDPFILMLGKGL